MRLAPISDRHVNEIALDAVLADIERVGVGCSGTVLAGGHTHIQMLRQHRGMLIVNPGSVGTPFRASAQERRPCTNFRCSGRSR